MAKFEFGGGFDGDLGLDFGEFSGENPANAGGNSDENPCKIRANSRAKSAPVQNSAQNFAQNPAQNLTPAASNSNLPAATAANPAQNSAPKSAPAQNPATNPPPKFHPFDPRICGIDEAGRGALAGELVVCGCAFEPHFAWQNLALDDSKKLSPAKRERIAAALSAAARAGEVRYLLVFFRNTIIDSVGISECLRRALRIFRAAFAGRELLFDGNCDYGVGVATRVRADAAVAQVAAASVLAKVARDAQMLRFAARWADYDYAAHKGYGTAAHIAALRRLGANELTRRSFCGGILGETLF